MVQGKFKKAKLPASVQKKQKQKTAKPFTRRSNAPIQPKKAKFNEQQKIKNAISKTVNKSVENELRSRAVEGQIKLCKAQEAVAKHHQAKAATEAGPSTSAS
nr:leydig cell tumor 10 kDa protein homolog [Bactrocera oleae]